MMPVTLICQNPDCGIEYQTKPSQAKKSHYCSRDCHHADFGRRYSGKSSPGWKGGQVELTCKQCGVIYRVPPSRRGMRFCSTQCLYLSRKGQFAQSKNPHWAGDRIEYQCLVCGAAILSGPGKPRKYCSRKCSGVAYRQNHSGSNSHRWKGGLTSAAKIIRAGNQYKEWRQLVFERDGWTCQKCGTKRSPFHAHHIFPFALFPEHRHSVWNGITLCPPCHAAEHPEIRPLQKVRTT